jgi:hypothetical protein
MYKIGQSNENRAVMHTFFHILRFGGTLLKFDGTLVRRGTPVEKHCLNAFCHCNCIVMNILSTYTHGSPEGGSAKNSVAILDKNIILFGVLFGRYSEFQGFRL